MGSRDEEVRSWKLQTFNRPAVAVVLSRLIGTAEHDIIEPIPVDTTKERHRNVQSACARRHR
jgi:hypothetical protein